MDEKIPEVILPDQEPAPHEHDYPAEGGDCRVPGCMWKQGHVPNEPHKDNVVQMPTPNEVIANRAQSWQEHLKVTPLDVLRSMIRQIENDEFPIDGILVLGGHWDNDDPNTFMPTLARAKLTDNQLVFLLEWCRQELFTRYIAVR